MFKLDLLKEDIKEQDHSFLIKRQFLSFGEYEKDGWVYDKKTGVRLRKFFISLRNFKEPVLVWKPKADDLVFCENKRWKIFRLFSKQHSKLEPIFHLVLKNTPFSFLRDDQHHRGWINFTGDKEGFSWDYTDEPTKIIKQRIGEAYFYREKRSRELYTRKSYFENLFVLALEKEIEKVYSKKNNPFHLESKLNLTINGRSYFLKISGYRCVEVLAYPEETDKLIYG